MLRPNEGHTTEEQDVRVLLLEDNASHARILTALLRFSGMDTDGLVVASRLAEAMALARTQPFDVAILDLELPDATGLQALHGMSEAAPRLPIVVLTSEHEEQTALQALQNGAQDYVLRDRVTQTHLRQTMRFAIERKRSEDALRERERELSHIGKMNAIGHLAAGIAHEINTPMQYVGDNVRFLTESTAELAVVLRAAAAVADASRTGAPVAEAVAALVTAMNGADIPYLLDEIPGALGESAQGIAHVTRIVGAMKEFSHPGTHEIREIDVARVVQTTLTLCRNEWKYVAEAVTDIPDDLPPLPCHPGEISQVLLNLIVNAAHAIGERVGNSGQKGRITVAASASHGHIELRVSDDGAGIPEHVRDRIFEPFFTTKEVGRGTGQGLSVAYKVAHHHGGSIGFDSTVSVGTTFWLRLPMAGAAEPVSPTVARSGREMQA